MKEDYWGYHLTVDASGLNPEKIRSKEVVRQFLKELIEHIHMTAYGEPWIERFGVDEKVAGITFFAPILESCCTGHLVEQNSSGYFDVFSCCPFDAESAVLFILSFFDAEDSVWNFKTRQAPTKSIESIASTDSTSVS